MTCQRMTVSPVNSHSTTESPFGTTATIRQREPTCRSVMPANRESEVSSIVADRRAEVIDSLADRVGTRPLTAAEIESVLALAAVDAHGTGDRTTAPLTAFLAGVAAAAADDRITLLDGLSRHVADVTAA